MVTGSRKWLTIEEMSNLLRKHQDPLADAIMEEAKFLPAKRKPKAPPPPNGYLWLRAAAREYSVHHTTIIKWINKGLVNSKKDDNYNRVYVKESDIKRILNNGNKQSN